jgi:amino acid permease
MKAAMGVGLLAYPHMFHTGGYLLTTLLVIVTAMSIFKTNKLMIEVTEDVDTRMAFDQVILRVLGPAYTSLYRLLIVLLTSFTCIAYLMYISVFLGRFLTVVLDMAPSQLVCLMLSCSVFVPLSLIKDMKNFYLSSILGNLLMYSIVCFLLVIFCIKIAIGDHQPITNKLFIG